MPRFNGTGPDGRGPATGGGRGWCRMSGLPGRHRGLMRFVSIATPIASVIANDVRKPEGLTRRMGRAMRRKLGWRRNTDYALDIGAVDKDRVSEITDAQSDTE